MKVDECRPKTGLKGLRAQRECAKQIIDHLSEMEKDYFERRKASCLTSAMTS